MNLRNIRYEHDLTQKEVAEILGVTISTYSLWENQINFIPLPRLIKFCNYFNVSLDYTLNLSKEKNYFPAKKEIDYSLYTKRLKLLRKTSHLTQNELASKLNTDNGVISRYENGKTLILTAFLIEYAKIFNVSCDYIMGFIDEKKPLNKY